MLRYMFVILISIRIYSDFIYGWFFQDATASTRS